jgi:hypothetical protein
VLTPSQVAKHWAVGASAKGVETCPVAEPTSTYARAVLADKPGVYLRGSEVASDPDSAVALDYSGNCAHGARHPGATSIAGALVSDADPGVGFTEGHWAFEATGKGLGDGFDARSVELWFQTTSVEGGWLFRSSSSGAGIYKRADSTTLELHLGAGEPPRVIATGWPVADGRWHQLVFASKGDAWSKLYLDGQFVHRDRWVDVWGVGSLQVGEPVGAYDEVAVYPSVLSGSQVATHWRAGAAAQPLCPVAAPSSPYAEEVLADKPALYLRGSDIAGDPQSVALVDSSTRCAPAARGASVQSTPGAIVGDSDTGWDSPNGQPVALVSGDGLPYDLDARTIELWFKTAAADSGTLFSYGTDTLVVSKDAGSSSLQISSSKFLDLPATVPVAVADGEWHQLTVSYGDPGTLRVYVDGKFVEAGDFEGTGVRGDLVLGGLIGSYDEVAVYPTALSQARITEHWKAGTGSPSLPCAAAPTTR